MNCLKCNVVIDESKDKSIKCDGCGRSVHTSCSLSVNELKCYELRSTSKRRLKYICLECEQGIRQIPKMMSLIAELRDEMRSLREERSTLNQCQCASTHVASAPSLGNTEEIISEMFDRCKRASNLIIFGSVETGSTKEEQSARDISLAESLLTACELNVANENIKPIRLGKFDQTKQAVVV